MGREIFIDLGAPHTTVRLSADDSGNLLVNDVAVVPSTSLLRGSGAPAVAAVVGTLYSRTDPAANQLYVKETGSGTTGWQPVATSAGVFNVKDYGALGDGVTDDYTAIAAAVAAANAASGGVVYFPPGVYMVGTSIVVPNNVRIVGCDKNSSIVKKSASIILFDFSGASNASRCGRGGMMDIKLIGNGFTGNLVRCKWADHLNFDRVWMYNNPDVGLYLENCWDTYFNNVEFDTMIGSNGFRPAVMISSNADDSSNIIVFNECRWENHVDGACWITSRVPSVAYTMATGSNPPYGIYFQNCKMETPQAKWGMIDMSSDVKTVHIDGLYMPMRGVFSGGPYGMILLQGADDFVVQRVRALIVGGAAVANSVIYLSTNGSVAIRDILVDAVNNPTNAVIVIGGGSPDVLMENIRPGFGQTPTMMSGTWPPQVASATTTTIPKLSPIVVITGTTTITSITAQRPGRVVTLRFAGVLTLTDGSNLTLAGNYVTTADDTITLVSDGTNWNEMCRSVN